MIGVISEVVIFFYRTKMQIMLGSPAKSTEKIKNVFDYRKVDDET